MVLRQHAVEQQRDGGRLQQLRIGREPWTVEDDVVGLPLARRTCGIHQRRILAIDRAGLAVRVGLVPVGLQHLNFVQRVQIHAAVARLLIAAMGRVRGSPLDVQLAISERLLGDDVAGAGGDLEVAVAQFPGDGLSVVLLPGGKVPAVEELHGIGRSGAGVLLRAGFAGRDHGGQRPATVAGFPLDHWNRRGESGKG